MPLLALEDLSLLVHVVIHLLICPSASLLCATVPSGA